ncbi:MAG: adenylate/guanylate cyclase domain-containing protein, partial [Leptospiraceae bacterium]|nr:adenylate/guanylate cyclase domain-containing protein [Leptospiraceae bacterium]
GGCYLAVELFLRESGKLAGAFLVQFDEKPGHNTIHLALQAADEIDDFLIFNREMLEEVQLREKIMNVLIPMIGEDQSKFILSAHDPKKLSQPQQKYAIIMFSDLKGSTRTADVLMSRGKEIFEKYKNHRESPEYIDELVKLEKLTENYVKYINFYLGLSSRSVLKFGGVVDKYIGDAVMAAWGVPIDAPDPIFIARRAILATVFANRMTLKYNESMKQEGFEDLFIFQQRFVLHCGEVLAGIFGTPLRFDYTIMGAPVNEAARIESLETSAPGKVTFSREFYNLVNDFIEADHLGSFKLKGKENPIDIYRFKKFRNSNISEIAEEYIDRSKISISHAEDENFKDYLRDDWDID